MPPLALAAALLSAVIHAGWNALLKAGRDRLIDLGAMGLGGCAFGAALLAWRGLPRSASWGYLAASSLVHFAYWMALSRSYARGDMSQVYPIARGLAPVCVGIGALAFAHEVPSAAAGSGIALVSIGIAASGFSLRASAGATVWAAITGLTIAGYSLLDAFGVRAGGDALAYIGASALGTFLPVTLLCLSRRSLSRIRAGVSGRWVRMLTAGALSNAGFGLALWAQTFAPIAYVTALRETSVVFGTGIAASVLRERVGMRRWAGAGLTAIGAALLALGH